MWKLLKTLIINDLQLTEPPSVCISKVTRRCDVAQSPKSGFLTKAGKRQ
jgi:hypothetical protein